VAEALLEVYAQRKQELLAEREEWERKMAIADSFFEPSARPLRLSDDTDESG
jgi:hypothetical protein